VPVAERDVTLRQIIDCIGVDAAFRLVDGCGGEFHRIPRKPRKWLADVIGKRDAEIFCNRFSEQHMQIPKADRWKRAQRDRMIHRDFDPPNSLTVHQLVRKWGLGEVQIRTILNRPVEACDEYGTPLERPFYPNGDNRTIDMFGAMA
jgi:hypothetical protein